MSAERVRLRAEPATARIAPGDLELALERLIESREREAAARGQAAGRALAIQTAAGALDAAVRALENAHEHASHLAVEMALEIARVLLRRELRAANYDLEKIVREMLATSGVGRGRCVVHVHPDDAKELESVAFRAGTTIEADPALARGNVHVSTPQGLLVREFEEALDSIAGELREELS